MKTFSTICKSLSLLAVFATMAMTSMASAHETVCPYCKLKVMQNTKAQDNEVALKMGHKRIEYRCMYCVMKGAGHYNSDLVVYAPSEKVGEPIVLKHTDGKWSAPEGTVFLNGFKKHSDCATLSRAFTPKVKLDKDAAEHGVLEAISMNLTEFLRLVTKSSN